MPHHVVAVPSSKAAEVLRTCRALYGQADRFAIHVDLHLGNPFRSNSYGLRGVSDYSQTSKLNFGQDNFEGWIEPFEEPVSFAAGVALEDHLIEPGIEWTSVGFR